MTYAMAMDVARTVIGICIVAVVLLCLIEMSTRH